MSQNTNRLKNIVSNINNSSRKALKINFILLMFAQDNVCLKSSKKNRLICRTIGRKWEVLFSLISVQKVNI
jgi:hypothetical protein